MKRLSCIWILLGMFTFAHAQEHVDTPEKSAFPRTGTHIHFSSNVIVSFMTTINLEYYWHTAQDRLHWGVGGGGFVGAGEYEVSGAHAMANFWTGKGAHHFEMRAGAAFDIHAREVDFVVPILQLGYRYQKPGQNGFFYIDLGSAGLGAGGGIAL